jgi:hypothetical protein
MGGQKSQQETTALIPRSLKTWRTWSQLNLAILLQASIYTGVGFNSHFESMYFSIIELLLPSA